MLEELSRLAPGEGDDFTSVYRRPKCRRYLWQNTLLRARNDPTTPPRGTKQNEANSEPYTHQNKQPISECIQPSSLMRGMRLRGFTKLQTTTPSTLEFATLLLVVPRVGFDSELEPKTVLQTQNITGWEGLGQRFFLGLNHVLGIEFYPASAFKTFSLSVLSFWYDKKEANLTLYKDPSHCCNTLTRVVIFDSSPRYTWRVR